MKEYNSKDAQKSHYSCGSMYGESVKMQYKMQPGYGDGASKVSGKMDNGMQGAKRNEQKGP